MKPRLSVVIPAYNAERFIEETLESVYAQTHPADEIIVVNDGSTDRTLPLLQKQGDKIEVLTLPNQGVSAARNTGTQAARGEFIQYLDADDLLRPRALEKRLKEIEQSRAEAVYSDWQKLEEASDGTYRPGTVICRSLGDVNEDPQIALLTDFWAPPAAWLYSKSLVDRMGGWRLSFSCIEDARFALAAALYGGRFAHVPGVGADYRVHRTHQSLSKRYESVFTQCIYENARETEFFWRDHNTLNAERAAALAGVYDYTARSLLQTNYSLFKENLESLYRVSPRFDLHWPKVAGALAQRLGPHAAVWILDHLPRL